MKDSKKEVMQNVEKPSMPKWVLICLSLTPILLWPFIFFGSIFLFDDPNANIKLQYLLFYGINAYPLYLVINTLIANKMYDKYRRLSLGLFLWPSVLLGLLLFLLFGSAMLRAVVL